jgi:hypothetical protein
MTPEIGNEKFVGFIKDNKVYFALESDHISQRGGIKSTQFEQTDLDVKEHYYKG